jgi:hypothetical protein
MAGTSRILTGTLSLLLLIPSLSIAAEEAAARADLRQHADSLGVNQLGANPEAVQRMYDLIDGRVD